MTAAAPRPRARRGFVRALVLLALTLVALTLPGCGDDGQSTPPPQPDAARTPELRALLQRAIVECEQHRFIAASKSFREATEIAPNIAAIWTNLGIATMNRAQPDVYAEAEAAYQRALELEPSNLHALHSYGVLLKFLGRFDEARPRFERVLELDPHDPVANYYYATLLLDAGDLPGTEKHLRKALESRPHLSSAIYKLSQVLARLDRPAERAELLQAFRDFEAAETGDKASIIYTEMGRYGEVIREFPLPGPELTWGQPDTGRVSYTPLEGFGPPSGTDTGDEERGGRIAATDLDRDGDLDLYLATAKGAGRIFVYEAGRFRDATEAWGLPSKGRSLSGCFGDYDNDGLPDLYVCREGPDLLLRNLGDRFEDVTESAGVSGGEVRSSQAVFADLDADGDLDIYVANDGPNNLFNNNRDGSFTDIAKRTGTSGGDRRSQGAIATDLDRDGDADLVVQEAQGLLYRNDRIWRFGRVRHLEQGEHDRCAWITVGDAHNDGWSDLVYRLEASSTPLLVGSVGRTMMLGDPHPFLEVPDASEAVIYDADNDGDADLLLASPEKAALLLYQPDGAWREQPLPEVGEAGLLSLLAIDVNQDGILDLAGAHRSLDRPVVLLGAIDGTAHWVKIRLKGTREEGKTRANTGGIGARVEVVSGRLHQAQELRSTSSTLAGQPAELHFGLGPRTRIDYVRIVWPDDVVQSESEIPVDQVKVIEEVQRKSSSCPLLFAWDGERFAFVTDFLGTGGLGFFLEPGVYAPPDPTESVKIPKLAPKDSAYEIRVHEPMEEICYLDAAKLLVIDHPPGFAVYPDERMATADPPADGDLIVIREDERVFPIGLETPDGPADVDCILDEDRRYQPGVHPDRRFLGYAAPQGIVLDFGERLRELGTDRPLYLFVDGWVEYPYAHVNFAAWQAGVAMEPFSLDIETTPGTWKPYRESFGYPAGLPRTMTLEISDLPRDGTGRIRIRTNIEAWIDRLYLAHDQGRDGVIVRELDPDTAELRSSGYPREYSPDGTHPLLYDYALMDPAIDFKLMEGFHTRFGDVRELLTAADDRYVIMGRPEEVIVRYPVPDLDAGHVRSFVLKSTGWCKDMDLYTACPHTVEPLPFLGMSAFPYPPSEHYPDTPAHREYRKTWNTRYLHGSRSPR